MVYPPQYTVRSRHPMRGLARRRPCRACIPGDRYELRCHLSRRIHTGHLHVYTSRSNGWRFIATTLGNFGRVTTLAGIIRGLLPLLVFYRLAANALVHWVVGATLAILEGCLFSRLRLVEIQRARKMLQKC